MGRRAAFGHLMVLLLTGALVMLIGAVTGSSSLLAQDTALGKPVLDGLVGTPISGTFQMVLPLIHRDWQPALPQIVYLHAEPQIVAPGQSSVLNWGVNNEVLELTVLPDGTNVTGRTSLEVWPAQTTVYRLVAGNPLGSDSAEATVTVLPPPQITLFMAQPNPIDVGASSQLLWRVSETVDRLVLEPEVGDVTGQVSAWVSPTQTTVYSLTAYNAVGSATAEVTVTVNPPTFHWFRADPAAVDLGESSTLSWNSSQAVDSLAIEPGVGDLTGLTSVQVAPDHTTVYTLTAANEAGQDTEGVTVAAS